MKSNSTRFAPEMLTFLRSEAEQAIFGITQSGQPLSYGERVAKAMGAAAQIGSIIDEDFALRKEASELKDKIEELIAKVDKVTLENEKLRGDCKP